MKNIHVSANVKQPVTEINFVSSTMAPGTTTENFAQCTHLVDIEAALQSTIEMYNITPMAIYVFNNTNNATSSSTSSSTSLTQGMYFFRGFLSPVIIILGILGNMLSVGIFLHYRKWGQASIHYLFYLAISDTGNLLFNGVVEWFHIGLKYATRGQYWIDIPTANHGTCIFVRFMWMHCAFLSSWILVMFTLERFLVVCFPFHAVKWVTVGRRRRILVALTIFSLVSWFPVPFIYDVYKKHGFSVCLPNSTKSAWMASYFTFHSLATTHFLPCVLLSLFNIFIIIGIVKSNKCRQEMGVVKKNRKQDVKIAVNLLVVSSVYLILTIPFCLVWSVWFYWESRGFEGWKLEEIRNALEVNRFITSLNIINYSVNFCIYTARLTFFKRRVMFLLTCRRYTKLESTNISLQNPNDSPGKRSLNRVSQNGISKL